MTTEEALVAMLNANTAVSNLQAQPIKPWPLAQQWTSPAIFYHIVSAPPEYPLKGPRFSTTTTFQLDVQATGTTAKADARHLANAAISAIEGWAPASLTGIEIKDAWINNDLDDYEVDPLIYRVILDCAVLWQ